MSALPKRYFTQEEYAKLEEKADYKSQYVGGEIFAIAGAQPWHLKVVGNIFAALHTRFRGKDCEVFFGDARVRAKAGDLWTYPDVAALCGTPVFDTTENPHSLLNPQVIFEVLSPSTENFDRSEKFSRYQKIDAMTDYVLVGSESMRVEHYTRREADAWLYREFHTAEDVLRLSSVEVELPLTEIYEAVVFPE